MNDVLDNTLPLTAGGDVNPPAEIDDGGCFKPFIPQVSVSPAPAPAPKPKPRAILGPICDKLMRASGYLGPLPNDDTSETGVQAPVAAGSTGDSGLAPSNEMLTAPVAAPLPTPRTATAAELIDWIRRSLLAQTHLHEDVAELVAFWAVSTWFQDSLTILPCLVITGPAHHAGIVLHILDNLCRGAKLLAGFRRSHLGVLHWECQTNLVSEPNLDERTANLLSNLTDRNFSVVEGRSLTRYSKSTAIYAGENPGTHKIQNSIHIHIPPYERSTARPCSMAAEDD